MRVSAFIEHGRHDAEEARQELLRRTCFALVFMVKSDGRQGVESAVIVSKLLETRNENTLSLVSSALWHPTCACLARQAWRAR